MKDKKILKKGYGRSYGHPNPKECRHRWRVGSYIGYVTGKQIRKKGINIWCEKCNKKIRVYYKPK